MGTAGPEAQLEAALAGFGLDNSPAAVNGLLAYTALLKEWSGSYNLVARRDREFLLERHVIDSLSLAPWLRPGSLLDVGAGAGLPGLPLAIVKPDLAVTLLDSAGKKIRFIRHVKRTLRLGNVEPLQQRLENLDQDRVFANITSRAFASLRDFAEGVRGCADRETRLLAMKGAYPAAELEALPGDIHLQSIEKLTVPGLHAERHLVIMSIS